jgi:hypothetical protein
MEKIYGKTDGLRKFYFTKDQENRNRKLMLKYQM